MERVRRVKRSVASLAVDLGNRLGLEVRRSRYPKRVPLATGHGEGPPLAVEAIEDVFSFFENVPPLYDESVPQPLRIAGAWRDLLSTHRATQLTLIEDRRIAEYREFAEGLFFNELVVGIHSHGYWPHKYVREAFLRECAAFERQTSRSIEKLPTNRVWRIWGYETAAGIVKYTDPDHGLQASRILRLLDCSPPNGPRTVLDLGSGFGGMAEKLACWSPTPITVFLIDIPLNLTTAYLYLQRIFGRERVTLVGSEAELKPDLGETDGHTSFVLAPSSMIETVTDRYRFDVVNNRASLCEMDAETIRFYLDRLLRGQTTYFIETNSDAAIAINSGHIEVPNNSYPIPAGYALLGRFADGGVQERYMTNIYRRTEGGDER